MSVFWASGRTRSAAESARFSLVSPTSAGRKSATAAAITMTSAVAAFSCMA